MINPLRLLTNAASLYFQVVAQVALVFLTTRYVLAALGVGDYSLYIAIAGVMGFMGFLTTAMAASAQRHLAYELGRSETVRLSATFSSSLALHILLAGVILVLGESLGLWFVEHILSIPDNRRSAAVAVFHLTVVSAASYVLAVPYQAVLTAREQLWLLATVNVAGSSLSLAVAIWLTQYEGDRLVVYAGLSTLIVATMVVVQAIIARWRFPEATFVASACMDRSMIRELTSFSGWNLFGALANVSRLQGMVVVVNVFFSPVATASLGVANQLLGAIKQLTHVVLQATSPQIVKTEGSGDREKMLWASSLAGKYAFFVAALVAIPLYAEADTVLELWLHDPPASAATFLRILLAVIVIDQLSFFLSVPIQAIGRIGLYQSALGGLQILTVPIAIILAANGASATIVISSVLGIAIATTFLRPLFLRRLTHFPYLLWFRRNVVTGLCEIIPVALSVYAIGYFLEGGSLRVFVTTVVSVLTAIVSFLFLGLSREERLQLLGFVWRRGRGRRTAAAGG